MLLLQKLRSLKSLTTPIPSLQFDQSLTQRIPPADSSAYLQPEKTHIVDYRGTSPASPCYSSSSSNKCSGEIHCDTREDSDYDLSLLRDGDLSVGIDASKMGNEGRFVNDYRGIPGQDKPNAVFMDVRTPEGELKMTIQSSRVIKKGQEILVSYGKAWWQARQKSD
ncbi:hypothetical protein B0H15DRAFT_813893 [Mycena belliarum]|uniref:SET domain-containing protein n=1 Tax=Mycena belliarum TaxID=1033014 RepID=A0AAD6UJ76_9AGAR|nr:hypothetical protein B0H15DRAFT_813893 [Mycena belliae]